MPGCWTSDSAHKDDYALQTRVTDITSKDDALLTARLYPPSDLEIHAHLQQWYLVIAYMFFCQLSDHYSEPCNWQHKHIPNMPNMRNAMWIPACRWVRPLYTILSTLNRQSCWASSGFFTNISCKWDAHEIPIMISAYTTAWMFDPGFPSDVPGSVASAGINQAAVRCMSPCVATTPKWDNKRLANTIW